MTAAPRRPLVVLMADDDDDDRLLAREAHAESRAPGEFRAVGDGAELLDYLYQQGRYAVPGAAPRPGLVLLDLNMPGVDGREALRRIRADPAFRALPVIVMTTSRSADDVARGYALGASTVIAKPVSFDALVEVMRLLSRYWLELAEPSALCAHPA